MRFFYISEELEEIHFFVFYIYCEHISLSTSDLIIHSGLSFFSVSIDSEVLGANQAAVQLYRSFGFEPRENPDRRSPNIFMMKELY
jgi:hypothetical protein